LQLSSRPCDGSPRQWTCGTTAQFKRRAGIGPAHDRRRARRTGTDPAGTTRSGSRSPGNAKTPAAWSVAGVGWGVRWLSQRRRCLNPPCRSPGRMSYVCCAFSPCADSLASVQPSVGRNLITVFSAVNTPREKSSRPRPRRSHPSPPASHPAARANGCGAFASHVRASRESTQNKHFSASVASACDASHAAHATPSTPSPHPSARPSTP
jgi:hypothetical protein